MKNLIFTLSLLFSFELTAQIVVFQPVHVPADKIDEFLNIELNYSKKTAQDAVNKGELEYWILLESTNPKPDGFNYIWVNAYKDIATAVNKGSWWNNSKNVVGVETPILYSSFSGLKADRRYYYKMEQEIEPIGDFEYVILNFTNTNEVQKHLKEMDQYVIPHFKKIMSKHGMMAWGSASKITPQGDDVATMMTYDSYDTLEHVMEHLSGEGVIGGLDFDKLTPIQWSMRPVMRIKAVTGPKQ